MAALLFQAYAKYGTWSIDFGYDKVGKQFQSLKYLTVNSLNFQKYLKKNPLGP